MVTAICSHVVRVVSLSSALRVGGFRELYEPDTDKLICRQQPHAISRSTTSRLLHLGQRPSYGYTHAYEDTYWSQRRAQ